MASSPELVPDSTSRERILSAAIELFVRDGFKSTSMKSIAVQVGISPPALYWHFPSKRDLFLASMEALLDDFMRSVETALTGRSAGDLLVEYTRAHVVWRLRRSSAAATYTSTVGVRDLVHTLPPAYRTSLMDKQRRHIGRLRTILGDGVADGSFAKIDVRVASFAIITMCDHSQTWYDPGGEYSPEDIATRYVDLVLAMVGARPAPIDNTRVEV